MYLNHDNAFDVKLHLAKLGEGDTERFQLSPGQKITDLRNLLTTVVNNLRHACHGGYSTATDRARQEMVVFKID